MGWAAVARAAAYIVLIAIMLTDAPRPIASITAIFATGSLCWNGHGAMTDGGVGWVHLAGNAVHLVAGLSWIGAIAAFLWAALRPQGAAAELSNDLDQFAKTGTVFVVILLITGIANTSFIVGWDGIAELVDTAYGRILFIKLSLFVAMLVPLLAVIAPCCILVVRFASRQPWRVIAAWCGCSGSCSPAWHP